MTEHILRTTKAESKLGQLNHRVSGKEINAVAQSKSRPQSD